MINAQLFYKDSTNIIYSLSDSQAGRYFLNVPVTQYNNFMTFLKLKKEDNTKKGTSEYSNEITKRKDLLEDIKKTNEFIKNLNNNMVYSRVNKLTELPVQELEDILNGSKPFDMQKYKEITQNIEDIINDNFRLMTSSNVKKESIEQTILLLEQREPDKEFINWLKEKLTSDISNKNLEDLRIEYNNESIKLNIEDYMEIKKENENFIIGKNLKGETFSVKIPPLYNMKEVFDMELKTVDKSKLTNTDGKLVATILFEKILLDLPSEKMINKEELEENKNNIEQDILDNETENKNNNYVYDTKNNIAIDSENNKAITVEKDEYGRIIANDAEVSTYNYDTSLEQPSQTETITQSKGKRRVLVPTRNENSGFIKVGTMILFTLSFILTIISLILLIAS